MFSEMISFVCRDQRLPAGAGGSVSYLIGHARELRRRGTPVRIVTKGREGDGGRSQFPDLQFAQRDSMADLASYNGVVVLSDVIEPAPTKKPPVVIFHSPPPPVVSRRTALAAIDGSTLVATSRFAAGAWADYFGIPRRRFHIVYPFAEPAFGQVRRPARTGARPRILFGGRLSPEKGIFTLLEMLSLPGTPFEVFKHGELSVTATTTADFKLEGQVVRAVLEAHPGITVVPSCANPAVTASLMAQHDIVVMPSNHTYWHETFGMVSVEAQSAGCWVVASDDGGLPETDCGGLILVEPGNAQALARGIDEAIRRGPVPADIRANAARTFSLERSVDSLLRVISRANAPRLPLMKPKPRDGVRRAPAKPAPAVPAADDRRDEELAGGVS
jgi:D-inositol-3-phosphate glycosyltransferase